MEIFSGLDRWPVDNVSAAVISSDGVLTHGDVDRPYRLASLSKVFAAWSILIATEEGVVDLDGPLRFVDAPPGATMRHLLSHAAGFGFDGDQPVTGIERRRIYSNTGIERAADELAGAARMPFEVYLGEAVFDTLQLESTELRGSPAFGVQSTLGDMIRLASEMRRPQLLAPETYAELVTPQYPALAGIVPGVGRFNPCPWGLGVEIRGDKSPHWTGTTNAPSTVGHFGGAGTMMWYDPAADVAVVALTDRPFDEWSDTALSAWPAWSDEVVASYTGQIGTSR